MARDYGRSRQVRRGGTGSRQFLQMVMAFLTGYLVASIFDFASLTHWVNTRMLAQQTSEKPASNLAQASGEADLPKPKFEFYTLLANGRTQAASTNTVKTTPVVTQTKPKTTTEVQTAATTAQPPVLESASKNPQPSSKESWIIQVGSFKTMPEAERMKAGLILKGYAVSIVSISQPQGNWFRVLVGPYSSQTEAQLAQVAFSKNERVVGMVRKA